MKLANNCKTKATKAIEIAMESKGIPTLNEWKKEG